MSVVPPPILFLTLLKIKIIQSIPQREYYVCQGTVMVSCFLREDELSKTRDSAGLVPRCPNHSPALSEQDKQDSPEDGSQVEVRVQIIRQVRSRGQVK